MTRTVFLTLSMMLMLCAAKLYAQEKDQYQNQIDSIAKKIISITKNLNTNKAKLKTERDELLKQEQLIGRLNGDLATLRQAIKTHEKQIDELDKQEGLLEQQSKADRAELEALIRQRYMQANSHYLKMLLDQKNPYAVGRLRNYYNYFHQAQQQKLAALKALADSLSGVRQEQQLQREKLQRDIQALADKRGKLSESKKERERAVAQLSAKVAQDSKNLSRLKADRQRLRSLLEQLAAQAKKLKEIEQQRQQQRVSRNDSKTKTIKGSFLKQKGRLKVPVRGSLKYRYGNRLVESGMRAEGLFFNTDQPRPVHSIFSGRVLFADFLKGYGLLIIVDHGDQHISLYGHNELLYKKVGDMVATDEVISKSGITGGLKTPGLYFEIRKNATPVDPAEWCRI